eukprot:1482136-Ditylum_brightwellii.AAC.1
MAMPVSCSQWSLPKQKPRDAMTCSVFMLVHMEVASAVKMLAPAGYLPHLSAPTNSTRPM